MPGDMSTGCTYYGSTYYGYTYYACLGHLLVGRSDFDALVEVVVRVSDRVRLRDMVRLGLWALLGIAGRCSPG